MGVRVPEAPSRPESEARERAGPEGGVEDTRSVACAQVPVGPFPKNPRVGPRDLPLVSWVGVRMGQRNVSLR